MRTNTNGHKLCTKATHHSCGLLWTASVRGRRRRASVVRATRPGVIGFVDSPDIRVVFTREAACAVELHARRRGREYVEPTEPVHVGYGSAIEPSIPKPSITLHHHKTTNSPILAHRLLSNLRPQQPTGRAVPRIPRAGTRRTSACSRASTSTATPAAGPCTNRSKLRCPASGFPMSPNPRLVRASWMVPRRPLAAAILAIIPRRPLGLRASCTLSTSTRVTDISTKSVVQRKSGTKHMRARWCSK